MKLAKHYIFAIKICLLLVGLCSLTQLSGQDEKTKPVFLGNWSGTLNAQGSELELMFNIQQKEEKLAATIDIPAQGVKAFNASDVIIENQKITIKFSAFQALYEGSIKKDGTEITGQWKQGGMSFDLVLNKSDLPVVINRPQEPKAPFPYLMEEITYPNTIAGIELSATLTLPKTETPHAVAILISGSGPQNRDEELMGHKPFFVLADYLTRKGIAVLRYDDRGVGKSTGDFKTATSLDFSKDVLAGINYLKTRKDIDPKKIGLIGHSEGGMIAPMLAAESELAFIVLLAGPGIKCDKLLILQEGLIARSMGETEENIKENALFKRQIYDIVKEDFPPMERREKLLKLFEAKFDSLTTEEKAQLGESTEIAVDAMLKGVGGVWFRYFLNFDPAPYLTRVKCPTLAINGAKDLQVPSAINLKAIKAALEKAPCDDYTIKEFPELNHLFQTAETGAVSEYYTIEETFSPEALAYIQEWISKRIK